MSENVDRKIFFLSPEANIETLPLFNLSNLSENSTNNSSRTKDVRSVNENKRRCFSRSCSSSDSEESTSTSDLSRSASRKRTHSPRSLKESSLIPNPNSRCRSLSNAEDKSGDSNVSPLNNGNPPELNRKRSVSRTGSTFSNFRFASNSVNDEIQNEAVPGERFRNQSQVSISSKVSVRHTTPRESIVFTKTEAPMVIRILQENAHLDLHETIRVLVEHQRSQESLNFKEQIKQVTTTDVDFLLPTTRLIGDQSRKSSKNQLKSSLDEKSTNFEQNSPKSVLSTFKYSLSRRRRHKSSIELSSKFNQRSKQSNNNRKRTCCIISWTQRFLSWFAPNPCESIYFD